MCVLEIDVVKLTVSASIHTNVMLRIMGLYKCDLFPDRVGVKVDITE